MLKESTGFAIINDAQVYYQIAGRGDPLVLLHAGVADSRMWAKQIEDFARHYQVICFDLPGFGQSPLPPKILCYHETVRDLLDYLGLEEIYLLGISFGGLIALDVTLAWPERVKALMLGAPSVSGNPPSERIRQFWAEENAFLEKDDLTGATELNLKLWVDGPQRTPDQVDPWVRGLVGEMQHHAFQIPEPEDLEGKDLEPPAIDRLGEIETPTLIMVGDLDLPEKVDMAETLAAKIPNAQKAIISGVAHMLNMEKPAEFNGFVLDFLREL